MIRWLRLFAETRTATENHRLHALLDACHDEANRLRRANATLISDLAAERGVSALLLRERDEARMRVAELEMGIRERDWREAG